ASSMRRMAKLPFAARSPVPSPTAIRMNSYTLRTFPRWQRRAVIIWRWQESGAPCLSALGATCMTSPFARSCARCTCGVAARASKQSTTASSILTTPAISETHGSVYHKVSTKEFGPAIMPEDEKTERYFASWSSAATADFVAMMAMGARVFQPYDKEYAHRCLEAARRSYAFLRSHPENHRADL